MDTPSFLVSWTGQDGQNESGIKNYDIHVSDNGGAFTLWLGNTTLTEETYTGVNGHNYSFYSIARDNVGNIEDPPTQPDATTTIELPVTPGDTNGDGVINVLDMTKVARIILQMDQPTSSADCNQGGKINVLDMICIARKILGLD